MKYILIISTLLLSNILFAQKVNIEGIAVNQPDKLIRIQVYADQFSKLSKTIATTQTDKNGTFFLNLDIKKTDFAFLALDLNKSQFYLSPNCNYNITIPEDTLNHAGSIFDKTPLLLNIESDNNTQKAIEEFNYTYNNFVYNNVNSIYKSRSKKVVTTFADSMLTQYKNATKYTKDYVTYSVASLYWLSNKLSNTDIAEKYFVTKPVLYNNIQYTEFFTDFYKSYFSSEKTFRYEDMISAINYSNSILELDKLVSRDSLLSTNKQVREIVEMEILARNYFNRDINQKKVDDKFKEIEKTSKYVENRNIAANYLVKLNQLKSGTKAPILSLTDGSKSFSLDNFKGKFLLLNFITDDCNICNYQMTQLAELRELSNNSFDILTIVVGKNHQKILDYATLNKIDWPILQVADILNLESYQVATYPSYILINPDGTIAYTHLPMPEENMALYIQRFVEKYGDRED